MPHVFQDRRHELFGREPDIAHRDLKSGGIELPRLGYQQARAAAERVDEVAEAMGGGRVARIG